MQTLTVQTDNGIVGSIFGLAEIDREKDRGKVLTPEIDCEIDRSKVLTPEIDCERDRSKVLTPRKDCKMEQDKVLGTDQKDEKTGKNQEKYS